MAESRVIEAYLTELRYSVAKLDDADDIVDEAADHLYTAVDRLTAEGIPTTAAEAQVLGRFGSAALVAKVFAEEAKRGGAVSTTLTRRSGVAAIASVVLIAGGQTGNAVTSKGVIHGAFLGCMTAGFVAFAIGMWGIRRRHGGLGRLGRVAFWWFLAAPFIATPALYAGPLVLAVEWLLIMTLLGVGMIRARVLPIPAVVLFTMSPLFALTVVAAMVIAGLDAGPWFLSLLAPVAVGFMWLGWAMSREPALDVRSTDRRGPMATA
ncbi:MAG: hypothetical protein QOC92_2122 [Acidimicrobiaceae bacterium]|jgi:hypothetical protein